LGERKPKNRYFQKKLRGGKGGKINKKRKKGFTRRSQFKEKVQPGKKELEKGGGEKTRKWNQWAGQSKGLLRSRRGGKLRVKLKGNGESGRENSRKIRGSSESRTPSSETRRNGLS